MRKIVSLLAVLILSIVSALSQTKTVTGRVTDANGDPIPYATVKIKGGTTGTAADQNGKFTIEAASNDILTISAAGFDTQEISLSGLSTVNVSLKTAANLQEVVVTALGITRSKNTLPFAAQKVKGSEVSDSRGSNFVNNLSGKVSGLEIRQTNSMGGSTNVILRVSKSLT